MGETKNTTMILLEMKGKESNGPMPAIQKLLQMVDSVHHGNVNGGDFQRRIF